MKDQNRFNSEMEKALETLKDRDDLKILLSRVYEKSKQLGISEEVEEFKKEVLKAPQKPEQLVFAFLPHQLAKVSLFFPMSDRELKEEERRISKFEHETSWGKIVIEGIKLAIFEEDIFLALLYLAKDSYKKSGDFFVLEVNINKIVNFIYGSKGYSEKNREVILRALKHFELVSFDLITVDWKKKGKERLKVEKIRSIGGIIYGFEYNEVSKMLKIYFNPLFFAYFLESMLTNINFTIRRKLKRDGSKALLRFISAHSQPEKMHILTVLNAINYNINQPMYLLRRRFKQFLFELKKVGVLGPKTKLFADDTVYFDILPAIKTIP